jgi:hypothetical protein
MKSAVFLLLAFLLPAAVKLAQADEGARQVNVTRDSAPGWTPSAEAQALALTGANGYFAALDAERYADAYAMMADLMKQGTPEKGFTDAKRVFHAAAGPLKKREFLQVTWTKDSAKAPLPGTYAAIDVGSYFEKIDRHCGYIVMHQKTDGGVFSVMREESNFITNAQADNIVTKHSAAELDKIWAGLARNCPNYRTAK